MKLQPLFNRVIVTPKASESSIIKPEGNLTADEGIFIVLRVGPDCKSGIQPNDEVVLIPEANIGITDRDSMECLIHETSIVGKVIA